MRTGIIRYDGFSCRRRDMFTILFIIRWLFLVKRLRYSLERWVRVNGWFVGSCKILGSGARCRQWRRRGEDYYDVWSGLSRELGLKGSQARSSAAVGKGVGASNIIGVDGDGGYWKIFDVGGVGGRGCGFGRPELQWRATKGGASGRGSAGKGPGGAGECSVDPAKALEAAAEMLVAACLTGF
ncbi:hypothetical protein Tco_0325001 [Tanacetum coccineum]